MNNRILFFNFNHDHDPDLKSARKNQEPVSGLQSVSDFDRKIDQRFSFSNR